MSPPSGGPARQAGVLRGARRVLSREGRQSKGVVVDAVVDAVAVAINCFLFIETYV